MPKKTISDSNVTPKQEKFIQNIINGMTQRQAYIDAFDVKTTNENTIDSNACQLFANTKVTQRYYELLEEQKERFISTTIEKRKLLKKIIFNDEEKLDNRLKAMDLDNKMSGEYVEKIDVNMNIDTTGELTFKFGGN